MMQKSLNAVRKSAGNTTGLDNFLIDFWVIFLYLIYPLLVETFKSNHRSRLAAKQIENWAYFSAPLL